MERESREKKVVVVGCLLFDIMYGNSPQNERRKKMRIA
jgi:hypothetical protein